MDPWVEVQGLIGDKVMDKSGHRIGKIETVAEDYENMAPTWAVVRTSLVGRRMRLVPLNALRRDGNDVTVPFSKESVVGAPVPEALLTVLPAERRALEEHYRAAA
jgi:sporulation protein YlmC with PRC-barrel domain